MYILPFYDTLHAAYVYKRWLPDDGWVVQQKHVEVCITIVQ
jgi:hypothetical protein